MTSRICSGMEDIWPLECLHDSRRIVRGRPVGSEWMFISRMARKSDNTMLTKICDRTVHRVPGVYRLIWAVPNFRWSNYSTLRIKLRMGKRVRRLRFQNNCAHINQKLQIRTRKANPVAIVCICSLCSQRNFRSSKQNTIHMHFASFGVQR